MSKNLKDKISILIKKFEIGKFQDVINDSLVILKKMTMIFYGIY